MTEISKKEKDNMAFYSPLFWQEEMRKRSSGKGDSRKLSSECWDRAAATYDDLDSCTDYIKQVSSVIDILRERGALDPENDVLDMACGTGSYAVRFASECRSIRCVDVSPAMLDELKRKIEEQGIRNIEIECSDWREFKSNSQYDLVFVSMSPILRSTETIDRLLALSSRHLCLITWAGIRENPLLHSLYKEIFGTLPPAEKQHSFQAIFNYLFTLGHAPDVKFFNGCWKRNRDIEGATKSLLWRLDMHRKLTEKEKETVRKRVKELCRDGKITVKTRVRIAAIFIDKVEETVTEECF